jgi:hypothetical protein
LATIPPVRITLPMLHKTFANIPAEAAPTEANKSLFLAFAIFKHYFGQAWLERHLEDPAGYLHIDESSQHKMDLAGLRIVDLAEVIYNLQHVENFDGCMERMSDGNIEDTAAELDMGRMLYLNKVPFRYIFPQNVKGLDYDAEIGFPDGTVACADAKCAFEITEFRAKAVFYKLEKARKQLPSDRPGIVFAKMPPHWMQDPEFLTATVDQANDFFRNTRRIVSVKFYVAPTSFEGGYVKQQHAFKELDNPKTRFGSRDWSLFRPLNTGPVAKSMPSHWQRILQFPNGPDYIDPPPNLFQPLGALS